MSVITKVAPQDVEIYNLITLRDVISILPERLGLDINVWIGDKIARYGQTTGCLTFIVEQDNEPSSELRLYFESLTHPIPSTVSNEWRNERLSALRLYNKGRLIIDKNTLTYKEVPSPTTIPILLVEDILKQLPDEVPVMENVYLTGSLVKVGWSGNDIDFMVDSMETGKYLLLKEYFKGTFNCKVDVGNADMPDREPVYKFLI